MTPLDVGLLALLCEASGDPKSPRIPLVGSDLCRHLEIMIGLRLTAMSVHRFLRAARDLGVIGSEADEVRFERCTALEVISDQFEMGRIGITRRFAIAERSAIDELVASRHPSCIHGLSRVLEPVGVHLAEEDIVASRDLEPEIRKRFGAPTPSGYRGETFVVRFTNKTPPSIFGGLADRARLSPILAAAHAMKAESEARGAGEAMWRRLPR